ncbi:MAG: class I SAM-dependent methyltransferase, partial [Candidatus Thorarchaeota archaeon]
IQPEIVGHATRFKSLNFTRILDLGCGSGRHTVYLAEQGFDVYGLDIAPTGLCLTIQKLANAGLPGHVTLSDMKKLPYEDAFFDAVISIRVIHHDRLATIESIVAEMYRVMSPTGQVWVTVPVPQTHPSREGTEIEPGTFVPHHGCEKGLPHHLFTKEELFNLFQSFTNIKIREYPGSHYSVLATKPR